MNQRTKLFDLLNILADAKIKLEEHELLDAFWLARFLADSKNAGRTQDNTGKSSTFADSVSVRDDLSSSVKEGETTRRDFESTQSTERVDTHLPKEGPAQEMGPVGIPLRMQRAGGLRNQLNIERSLRPLMRRIPSAFRKELDVDATVQLTADLLFGEFSDKGKEGEADSWLPVLSPVKEKWLDVVLIYDQWPSMAIWQPSVTDFARLLRRQGAFRSVSTWSLVTPDNGEVSLISKLTRQVTDQRPHDIRRLYNPTRRRLILLLSDCVAPSWYDGRVISLLKNISSQAYVALIQPLPQHLWPRTALGVSEPTYVTFDRPKKHYTSLIMQMVGDSVAQKHQKNSGYPLPIIRLEPDSLSQWAKALTGGGNMWIPAFILPSPSSPSKMQESITQEKSVLSFWSMATSEARRLAGFLAATPLLSLPLMHLIREAMLPESNVGHLAEVFLSGLLIQQSPGDPLIEPDRARYEFRAGVREQLLETIRRSEAIDVISIVFDGLSTYIEQNFHDPFNFDVIVADPGLLDRTFAAEDQPFAGIAASILRKLGWRYRELATYLENRATVIASQILARVNGLLEADEIEQAEALFRRLDITVLNRNDRLAADATQTELRRRMKVRFDAVYKKASSTRESHPTDYALQRDQWDELLRLEPVHVEAAREIKRLDIEELEQETRNQIAKLWVVLNKSRFTASLQQVEDIRLQIELLRSKAYLKETSTALEIERL